MKTGDFIREWRIKKGMTQEELAKKIGKSRTLLTHYETGRTKIPNKILYEIGYVLDIPESEIDDYVFPVQAEKNEIDRIDYVTERLEQKGFLILFDKNKNVYVYKDDSLLVKTSEHNFLGFYEYDFFEKDFTNGFNFTDQNFIKLLNSYGIYLSPNKLGGWFYEHWLEGIFEINDDVVFSLLFSALDRVKEELEDYTKFLTDKEITEEFQEK